MQSKIRLASVLCLGSLLGGCWWSRDQASAGSAPTVGTALSVLNVTGKTATLIWGAASDVETSPAALEYKLVYSSGDNLKTVEDAVANGTEAFAWTVAKTDAELSGLSGSSNYYVTVIVRDAQGNQAIYPTASLTTKCDGKVMFAHAVSSANLGGVSGADSLCNANKPLGFMDSTFKALLVDNSTRRACTTPNCGGGESEHIGWVFTKDSDYCTSDYEKRVGTTDSAGLITPDEAGALGTTGTNYYLGVGDNWIAMPNRCSNWASSSGSAMGRRGNFNATDHAFHSYGEMTCSTAANIVCVEQ